jgi:hypothetical protein
MSDRPKTNCLARFRKLLLRHPKVRTAYIKAASARGERTTSELVRRAQQSPILGSNIPPFHNFIRPLPFFFEERDARSITEKYISWLLFGSGRYEVSTAVICGRNRTRASLHVDILIFRCLHDHSLQPSGITGHHYVLFDLIDPQPVKAH